jgi:hypothetical protein
MKHLIFALLIIGAFSCKKEENIECEKISYDTSFTAVVGQEYCVDDANYVVIDSVVNQLCPCNADCFWEGEFILKMSGMASNNDFKYDLHTSSLIVDVQPFNDFIIQFESLSPDTCSAFTQKDFRVRLMLEKD